MSDRIPTFADLCCAIAEGRIAATVDGSTYSVNALELRRYLNKFRSLPLPTITTVLEQSSSSRATPRNWSASQMSVI